MGKEAELFACQGHRKLVTPWTQEIAKLRTQSGHSELGRKPGTTGTQWSAKGLCHAGTQRFVRTEIKGNFLTSDTKENKEVPCQGHRILATPLTQCICHAMDTGDLLWEIRSENMPKA